MRRKANVWPGFVLAIAWSLNVPANSQDRAPAAPPPVETITRWLPPETETVLAANGNVTFPSLNRLAEADLDVQIRLFATFGLAMENRKCWSRLVGRKIPIVGQGACRRKVVEMA